MEASIHIQLPFPALPRRAYILPPFPAFLRRAAVLALLCCLTVVSAASELSNKYNAQHPLIIVGDWDKPPYEFLNDNGEPAGSNVDLMRALCKQLDIPCQFVLKEWSGALKTFERKEADIILANGKRYREEPYVCSENIINYNRICAATCSKDSTNIIKTSTLISKGVVLKQGDYTTVFFRSLDSLATGTVEYQTPKVALQGLIAGDYQYFCWGEEPLKWKINKLHLEGIRLCEVEIPVSEIHIVGRDRDLIYQLDDLYSRMKQSGEVQRINDSWMHPERVKSQGVPRLLYAILATVLAAALLYFFGRLSRIHVKRATRSSTEMKDMMFMALKMGNFHIMEYDIKHNLMTNRYGTPILPAEGITLEEFTEHIHPKERDEFKQKMESLLTGHERKFELKKRWRTFQEDEHWLFLDGHAMVETDGEGHPTIIVNAINDITHYEETERLSEETERKYERLSNTPALAMSFYDKDGWLIDINDRMKEICGITTSSTDSPSGINPDAQRFWSTVCLFDIPLFRNVYKPGAREPIQSCLYMKYSDMDIDRCVEYHVQPLFNSDGEVVNYYVTTIDLTDERDMCRQLIMLDHKQSDTASSIKQQKDRLEYLLHNSDRYLVTDSSGRQEVTVDNTPLLNARKQLAEVTAQANDSVRLKSGFMASMTHELRTPLNAIIGFTGVLDPNLPAEERAEYVRIVQNASDMMQRLLNDITQASTLNSQPSTLNGHSAQSVSVGNPQPSTFNLQYSDVSFAQAFDDICLTVQHRVQTPDVTFIKDVPQSQPSTLNSHNVTIDVGRVQQVITNFVTNAVKFTKQGHIRLGYRFATLATLPAVSPAASATIPAVSPTSSATVPGALASGKGIYVFCEDTGIGIPEDKQEIIFERFVKLDEFVQGTGMGLAICKSIVEHMGGTIGVSSQGPGKGSTFWFWIPAKAPQSL